MAEHIEQSHNPPELDLWPATGVRANPARLKFLMQACGYNPTTLARALGASRKTVNSWMVGSNPSNFLQQLSELFDVLPASLAYPIVPTPKVGPFFRLSSRAGYDKVWASATAVAEVVAELATYFERKVGLELPALPTAKFEMRVNPSSVAQAARTRFHLKPGPVVNVVRTAERAGVIVCYATQAFKSVEAYSVEVGGWPVMILKPEIDYYRQRWSAAHELGHLLMHRDASSIDESMEGEANAFAAEFLLPLSEVVGLLPPTLRGTDLDRYRQLKEIWGVSIAALVRRAHETAQISELDFADAQERIRRKGWAKQEPGQMETVEVVNTLPDALDTHLGRGFSREVTLRETGVPRDFFESFLLRAQLRVATASRSEY